MTAPVDQAVEDAAFRKKPVVIHAVQWDGTYNHAKQLETTLGLDTRWMTCNPGNNTCSRWKIGTLEDGHVVSPLDWIITGVKGEHYPCKPDIFEITYERATLARPLEVAAPVGDATHPDDIAVDKFATALKEKLSAQREKGYGGWETAPVERLQEMLFRHVGKGDPVDVGNFAMMLWNRGDSTVYEDQWVFDLTGKWPGVAASRVPVDQEVAAPVTDEEIGAAWDADRIAMQHDPRSPREAFWAGALFTLSLAASRAPVAVGGGWVLAPEYRGYANLGTGQYILNHTGYRPAELIISIANEEEKVCVCIRFENVAGLDALEQQLRFLREELFATPAAGVGGSVGAMPSIQELAAGAFYPQVTGYATPAQSVPLGGGEVLARKIFEHLQGWSSATFGWQDNVPGDYERAKAAHNQKCIAMIANEIAAQPLQPQDAKDARAEPDSFQSDSGECDRVQGPGTTDTDRRLAQLRFFRDLSEQQRIDLFRIFGAIPDGAEDEVKSHATEHTLFNFVWGSSRRDTFSQAIAAILAKGGDQGEGSEDYQKKNDDLTRLGRSVGK